MLIVKGHYSVQFAVRTSKIISDQRLIVKLSANTVLDSTRGVTGNTDRLLTFGSEAGVARACCWVNGYGV